MGELRWCQRRFYTGLGMTKKKTTPSDSARLVEEIRAYCRTHANPANALKWQRYFTEGYDAWGFTDKNDPIYTTKKVEWAANYSTLGVDGFLTAGRELFQSGKYEEGALAIQLLVPYRDELNEDRLAVLAGWFDGGVRNWAHVDVLCSELLSPLLAAGRLKEQAFHDWRTSPHRFQRRAAAVAMLGLLGLKGGPKRALAFAGPLMEDGEKVVHQGLGWLIKEVWKREPQLAEDFLMKWKDRAARLVISTACEKMTPERKLLFRAAARRKGQ
jgi:3-methyladenine DNA glycosylase AlkD